MKYDFHTHSILSDGSFTPQEVVEYAKEANVNYIALTDHDTMLSIDIAKELNDRESDITVFGGLEVSSRISNINKNAHILAYGCNRHNKALNDLVNTTTKRRNQSFNKSIDIINKKGEIKIDIDKIETYKSKNGFYKYNLLDYLVDEGFAKEPFCEATSRMLDKSHGYAFVDFEYPECTDAIKIIRDAGGIPILAHTFVSNNFSAIDELINAGLMGIEVYHTKHTDIQRKLLYDFCESKNMLVTCGSDFHRLSPSKNNILGKASVDNEKIRNFLSLLKNC